MSLEPKTETEQAVLALEELNASLDEAIRSENITEIPDLIARRGRAVTRLMSAHEHFPVPSAKGNSLLKEDKRLGAELGSLKENMGSELALSRRHAHASRMYTKHEK